MLKNIEEEEKKVDQLSKDNKIFIKLKVKS